MIIDVELPKLVKFEDIRDTYSFMLGLKTIDKDLRMEFESSSDGKQWYVIYSVGMDITQEIVDDLAAKL